MIFWIRKRSNKLLIIRVESSINKYNLENEIVHLPKINENINDDSINLILKSNDDKCPTSVLNYSENNYTKEDQILTENNIEFKEMKFIMENINNPNKNSDISNEIEENQVSHPIEQEENVKKFEESSKEYNENESLLSIELSESKKNNEQNRKFNRERRWFFNELFTFRNSLITSLLFGSLVYFYRKYKNKT